ncbi:MAG: GNAT family N-acetyltransferase, partial [Oscillospiraceae bacterium]|nr:GNAT family N-acetyltransferase [Oscillospiraceae bacterium]
YRWAIVFKENGPQPIGSIDVCPWREDGTVPEIGYCMGRRWWHQGIMTEALGAVIDFLFEQVGVQRIIARHDINNPHSGDVMRKCGMRFEGIREKSGQNNQGVCDMACYAIEATDR